MQKLQLTIPEPCHENWNNMTPNDQGRFCSSCAKTVVDFSAMTDAQLFFYFENLKNENVCGKVYPDQLDRSISMPAAPRKKIFGYWQYLLAFFMMLGKGQQSKAQGEVKGKLMAQPDTLKKPVHVMLGGIRRNPLPKDTKAIGAALPFYFITDEKGQPVAYASVQLLPKGDWMMADSTGKINLGKDHKVESLKISYIGFEEKMIALKDIPGNAIELIATQQLLGDVCVKSNVLNEELTGRLGGISYSTVRVTTTFKDSIRNILAPANSALTLFPSPVTKGGTLNFSIKLKQTGLYKIQVADANGHVVLQQDRSAANKNINQKIALPANWSSGIYFITVYNEKNKIMGTNKFIIQ